MVLYYEVSVYFIPNVLCVRSKFLEPPAVSRFFKSLGTHVLYCVGSVFLVQGSSCVFVRACVCVESYRGESSRVVVCCVHLFVQLLRPCVTFCDCIGNLRVQKSVVQLDEYVASVMCSTYMSHHTVLVLKKNHLQCS